MAIENSVSNDFLSMFVDSINIFDCGLSGVIIREEKWVKITISFLMA